MPFGYLIRIRGAPLYVLLLRSTERVQVVELSAGENVVVGPLAIFFLRRSVDFLWFVDMLAPLYRQAPLAPQRNLFSPTLPAHFPPRLPSWRCRAKNASGFKGPDWGGPAFTGEGSLTGAWPSRSEPAGSTWRSIFWRNINQWRSAS